MGTGTEIPWAHHSWNPWQGCHPVSESCSACYMYRDKKRYGQDPSVVVRSKPPTFNMPLREARKGNWKPGDRVFVCSWSDFFIEEADPWRREAFDIMRSCPELIFMLLTKRIERAKDCIAYDSGLGKGGGALPANCWLGVTAENQPRWDERVRELLAIRAAVHFVSVEPMLGSMIVNTEVDRYEHEAPGFPGKIDTMVKRRALTGWDMGDMGSVDTVDLVIVGGESGPDARNMDPDWARSVRDQCAAAGVPFFFKQMSGFNPRRVPIPADLQIREMP